MANMPLLWVFGSRNDPFLWLTGWSFATYNRFHRWVARVATVEAIAHSVGYSVFSYYEGNGNFAQSWAEQYWYCGGIVREPQKFSHFAQALTTSGDHRHVFNARSIGLSS